IVEAGATASGTGTYQSLDILSQATIAPGDSVGRLQSNFGIWQSGGILEFEIASASGLPGSQWDLWEVSGHSSSELTFTTLPGDTPRYVIALPSLSSSGPGLLTSFGPLQSYSWKFVEAQRMLGFNADSFVVDTSGFHNDLRGGTFAVQQGTEGLYLTFTPRQI